MKSVLCFILFLSFISCEKKSTECISPSSNPVCKDIVPTNELCAAYFSRWFFDKSTNTCVQKSYSGCTIKGFATELECEECKCK
jgi:hypothetical protein